MNINEVMSSLYAFSVLKYLHQFSCSSDQKKACQVQSSMVLGKPLNFKELCETVMVLGEDQAEAENH